MVIILHDLVQDSVSGHRHCLNGERRGISFLRSSMVLCSKLQTAEESSAAGPTPYVLKYRFVAAKLASRETGLASHCVCVCVCVCCVLSRQRQRERERERERERG